MAFPILLFIVACGRAPTPEAEDVSAQGMAVGQVQEAATEFCPWGPDQVASFEPSFPYLATGAACRSFQTRKHGECAAPVRAPFERPHAGNPDEPQTRLTGWHMAAACQCFPERRAGVARCLALADCVEFADCVVALGGNGWMPPGR